MWERLNPRLTLRKREREVFDEDLSIYSSFGYKIYITILYLKNNCH